MSRNFSERLKEYDLGVAFVRGKALPPPLYSALVENGSFPGDSCWVLSEAGIGGRTSEEAEGIQRATGEGWGGSSEKLDGGDEVQKEVDE